jgi:hypothetical protein
MINPSCLSCAQWVQQADIPEKFVLMSEPDHVWLKPMPNLMRVAPPLPYFAYAGHELHFMATALLLAALQKERSVR